MHAAPDQARQADESPFQGPAVGEKWLRADPARSVIQVEGGQGKALRAHLASHGIRSRLSAVDGWSEKVEVEGDVHPEILRAVLSQWDG
jgi:hypothetical protein